MFMKAKNGQTLPSREQHCSFFLILLTSLLQSLPCSAQATACYAVLTTLSHRRSSSLGFINARCHPVANTETGLLRTLICLFGHDDTHIQPTHHPGPLFTHPFLRPCVPSSALPCHTHFIVGVLCMQVRLLTPHLCCSSTRVLMAVYTPEAIAVSVCKATFQISEEVIGH